MKKRMSYVADLDLCIMSLQVYGKPDYCMTKIYCYINQCNAFN